MLYEISTATVFIWFCRICLRLALSGKIKPQAVLFALNQVFEMCINNIDINLEKIILYNHITYQKYLFHPISHPSHFGLKGHLGFLQFASQCLCLKFPLLCRPLWDEIILVESWLQTRPPSFQYIPGGKIFQLHLRSTVSSTPHFLEDNCLQDSFNPNSNRSFFHHWQFQCFFLRFYVRL